MMKKEWHYLQNSFDTATRRNYKKMLTLIAHHTNMLAAMQEDPFIKNLYDKTLPINTAYTAAWTNLLTIKDCRQGDTQRFKKMMKELCAEKVRRWDITVQTHFAEGTLDYKNIFNGGRLVFREGTYAQRIIRIATLAECLGDYEGLIVLRNEVLDCHEDLFALYQQQRAHAGLVKKATLELEEARRAAAVRMYANMGALMDKYCEDPRWIGRFFQEGKVRSPRRKPVNGTEVPVYSGDVAPLDKAAVLPGGIQGVSLFHLSNSGHTPLQFYTARLPGDPVPGSFTELAPGSAKDILPGQLGADSNLFLMAYNAGEMMAGRYEVVVERG